MSFIQTDIPTIYAKVVLDFMAERGFHPSAILRGTGIELSAIANPEFKINLAQQLTICTNALSESNIDGLGLLLGQRTRPKHLGILGYAIQTSKNIRQALRILVNYSTVSGALMDFQLQAQGNLQILSVSNVSARGDVRQFVVEDHLTTIDQMLKVITGGKFCSSGVTLDFPPPKWASTYNKVFNCHIKFDQTTITYQFDRTMLDLDIVFSDPEAARDCELKCEELISKMSNATSYADSIRRIILMLPSCSRNLTAVAEELRVSPRSLRRKLADEQSSFQQLLDEVRLELALQYLKNTTLPSEEIGSLIGFSDGASFRRAFKKWTGASPGVFREQQG